MIALLRQEHNALSDAAQEDRDIQRDFVEFCTHRPGGAAVK
jgi:hypothetical protein